MVQAVVPVHAGNVDGRYERTQWDVPLQSAVITHADTVVAGQSTEHSPVLLKRMSRSFSAQGTGTAQQINLGDADAMGWP